MAKNRVFEKGQYLSVTCSHPAAPDSGQPCRIGSLTGVATTDERTDGKTSVDFGPAVYDLSTKGVNDAGNSAVAAGDALYYVDGDVDDGTGFLSKKDSGFFIGYALEAVTGGSTATIRVLINGLVQAGTADIGGIIGAAQLEDESVTTAKLAADAVDGTKLADDAVGTEHLEADAVTGAELADNAVGNEHLEDDAVDSSEIVDGAVDRNHLSGGFSKVDLVAGQDETGDTTIPVTGLVEGDELVGVFVQDGTSGIWTERALADFTIGAGVLNVGANAADNTANKYVIFWNDLTA